MNRTRTTWATLALASAAVATGLVATSATAAPAALVAVEASAAVPADGGPTDDTDRGRPGGLRSWWSGLTDEQRSCLEGADLRRPVGPLDDAQREALHEQVTAAAADCSVELPRARAREFRAALTDEQRACLEDAGLTRPLGPMDRAQRQQLRADLTAAAQECGITLPARS